jgi:hypothetical protein
MNRAERQNDPLEAMRLALESKQSEIWTALPGIIESFDPVKMTAVVQPAVQGQIRDEAGRTRQVDLPLLLDVPVEFPNGGGFSLTFPVKPGDECAIEFQCRCIDGWWSEGGVRPPLEGRMHDLSDAVCRLGPRSQKRLLTPAVNTEGAQLRTDDGQAQVTILPDYTIRAQNPAASARLTPDGIAEIQADASIILEAPLVVFRAGAFTMEGRGGGTPTATIKANIAQQGNLTSSGDHVAGGKSLMHHTHPGDSGGTTGEPN